MILRRTQTSGDPNGYSNSSMVPPEMQQSQDDQNSLDNQQLFAQTLAQQASTMQPAQNMASPWGSVAQVAQGAAAGYMNQQNQAAQQALQRQKMYAMAQMLQGGFNTSQLPDAPRE